MRKRGKMVFGIAVGLVSLFLISANPANAQVGGYPQIIEQQCDTLKPCSQGWECFSFPGLGAKCAKPNPCSYFKCPQKTQCSLAESYPPQVKCNCFGSECPAAGGGQEQVYYDLLTQTQNISLWKTSDSKQTGQYRGILETPNASAEYQGKILVKDSKLFMDLPAGEKPINILPENAISKAKEAAKMEIKKIELKAEAEKPIYSVKGIKQTKLVALIPVTLEMETKVSAETGEVTSINKPWWSFLTWER